MLPSSKYSDVFKPITHLSEGLKDYPDLKDLLVLLIPTEDIVVIVRILPISVSLV